MDVKGAKALSERLAEAARNVDPPSSKALDSGDTSEPNGSPRVLCTACFDAFIAEPTPPSDPNAVARP